MTQRIKSHSLFSVPAVVVKLLMTAAMILAALATLLWPWGAPAVAQKGPNRAALVVRYADGSVETRCIAFSEASISGEELLQRSGLGVVMDYNALAGGAVCSIKGFGCSVQDCFCRCQGRDCEYWAYYHWVDGAWQYSQIGASGSQIRDGALEGWSWGPGNFSSGTEPPFVRFDEVCAGQNLALSAGEEVASSPQKSRDSAPTQSGSGDSTPLVGYAAFFVAVAMLLGVGFWVSRRRAR